MANILFVVKGTGGDLAPLPKIGDALKQRGHQVTLLSHCSYADLAKRKGWGFVALDTPEERQRYMEDGALVNSPRGFPAFFRRHMLPKAIAEFDAIRSCYSPGNTVIVSSHRASLVPILASEKLGIPVVRLFAVVSELIAMPLMEELYRSVLATEINEIREKLGLSPVTDWQAWFRLPEQNLALWPDLFAPPADDWPVKAIPVGFIKEETSHGAGIPAEAQALFENGNRPILISAGTGLFTESKFYAASAQACGLLDRQGILVTQYRQLVPDTLPKQVQHFDYLPFANLMPHLGGVIHHGGMGTLALTLEAGVPQLVLASGGDRPDNGLRVQNLGVGEYLLPPRWEPGAIASALDRILNAASVRENCQEFALRLRASDTAAEACNWIESVIPTPTAPGVAPSPTLAPDSKTASSPLRRQLSPEKQALLEKRLREKRQQERKRASAEQGLVSGPMPIMPTLMDYIYLPAQAWWRVLERLVEVPRILSPTHLKEVAKHLISHHDGLRLRLVKENDQYRLFIAESEQHAFEQRNLSNLSPSEQDAAIEAARDELWASLNFSTGPLFRVVFFELGPERLPRLFITLHHFAADAYSINILLNDFQTACRQLLMGEPIKLPTKTTSLKELAERMYAYVHSDSAKPEVAYWKSLPWAHVQPSPVDHPKRTQSQSASLAGSLDPDETQALMFKVPSAYNVPLWDVLITACVLTYAHFARLQPLLIILLHHGRHLTLGGLDLFRTVGNLYTASPLLLDIDLDVSLNDPEKVLRLVTQEKSRVPHGGAAWHWVSYYSHEKFISFHENLKIVPNVIFNYRGEINKPGTQTGMFREIEKPVEKATTHLYDVTGRSPHNCETLITAGRFQVRWEYFSALNEKATMERLTQEYLGILRSFIRMAG